MKSSVLVVVALIAVVLGVVGLVTGVNAGKQSAKLADTMASVERRIETLAVDAARLEAADRSLLEQTRRAFAVIEGNLRSVQDDFIAYTNTAHAAKAKPVAKAAESAKDDKAGAAKSSGAASGKTYTIKSGDTLTRVAKNAGVSVKAIQDANPKLDPTRLKIGQTITLP